MEENKEKGAIGHCRLLGNTTTSLPQQQFNNINRTTALGKQKLWKSSKGRRRMRKVRDAFPSSIIRLSLYAS